MAAKNWFKIAISLAVGIAIGFWLNRGKDVPIPEPRIVHLPGKDSIIRDTVPVPEYVSAQVPDSLFYIIDSLRAQGVDTLIITHVVDNLKTRVYRRDVVDTTATGDTLLTIATSDTVQGRVLSREIAYKMYDRRVEVPECPKFAFSATISTNIAQNPAPAAILQIRRKNVEIWGLGVNSRGEAVIQYGRVLFAR